MIGLLQRVRSAQVAVDSEVIGAIDRGLLVLAAVQNGDDEARATRLLERVLSYRVFADETGRMNRSLVDINGSLLLVPQFTLAADTRKGTRASFSSAAPPADGERLFNLLLEKAHACHHPVASGRFGADMQVTLTNDGPVTFWLES
jgi:D-tyrosyl-tRNA(Tyr) deacylase